MAEEQQINIRLLAVKALSDINRNGAYANLVLQKYISTHKLSDLDRRFFTELVYGTIRRRNYIDAIIEYLSKRKIKKLSSMVVEILRLSIYQIIYMDKVPESAAVNEGVKLTKKLARGLDAFVNAILRNVLRRREELVIETLARNEAERIAYTYNQPHWLVTMWLKQLGEAGTVALCEWYNQTPTLTARINTLVATKTTVLKEMKALGWEVEESNKLPDGVVIHHHTGNLEKSSLVLEGKLSFMDEASMAVAHVVDPKAGECILDCCAAPGGKTMHMAALMENKGHIIAGDVHAHKVELLKQNAKRLQVTCVEAKQHDATKLKTYYNKLFDKIVVDAPCSGLGVLQKKLDMRWRKQEEDLNAFPSLQLVILNSAAPLVKNGGVLVYSTCTINEEENEQVVKAFLDKHPEFHLEDANAYLPFKTSQVNTDKMVHILPYKDEMDGFFISRMIKD